MYRNPQVPSLARRVGISSALGLFTALLGTILEAIIGGSWTARESLDDIIIGFLVALVVFAYEQRRYRAILEKIRMISAMNHHVRNALQSISFAPYTEQEKQIRMIGDSVNRIEWALREILPGSPDGASSELGPAHIEISSEDAL